MKKNILFIGFSSYSFLNFYEKLIIKNSKKFNIYIITDYVEDFYTKRIENLKKRKIIKNFYYVNGCTSTRIFFKGFFQAHRVVSELKKVNFYKIVSSDFSKPEVEFIIKKLKKIAKVYAFSHHSYKYYNIKFNLNFLIRLKIRSFIRYLKFRFNQIGKYIFLSCLFFQRIPEKIFIREVFPLYSNYVDTYLTDKIHEFYFYKKQFPHIDIKKINRYTKNKVKNNNLLLLGTFVKNQKYEKVIASKTSNYLEIMSKKFKIKNIYYKPHPRCDNNFLKELIRINPKLKINFIKKYENSEDRIKKFKYVMGYDSSTLQDAANLFNGNIVIGLNDLASLLTWDPKPKILMGDFNKFKSGIIWINDLSALRKFDNKKLKVVSNKLQMERFNFFRNSRLFEKEVLN